MGSRLSVLAGLVAGVLVAVAVLALVILTVPPTAPPAAAPSASAPAVVASPSVATSASAVASPSGLTASTSPDGSGSVSASGTTNFHVGQAAPALSIPQVGGGTIDLTSLKGKPVWINFMQTTCPPCLDEFPIMNGFAARYAANGLVVIAVDIREDEGTVAEFATRLNATFPLGLDADGTAQQAWGAYGLPVHFWIDTSGIVRDGALGGIGPDVMARGVGAILPGVTVTP